MNSPITNAETEKTGSVKYFAVTSTIPAHFGNGLRFFFAAFFEFALFTFLVWFGCSVFPMLTALTSRYYPRKLFARLIIVSPDCSALEFNWNALSILINSVISFARSTLESSRNP